MADLTPDDVGYGGSFVINKPARLWNEKDIQDFNAKWADARKNFATYLDHDANGKRVAKDNFGGQPAFRVRLSNGQEAFMTSVPGDPFHVNVKMLNVPANSPEAQYHPVEIRPGAGDYGNMLKEVQNATLPSGESVGSKIRPNNLGDVVSQHNNLQYAKASIENQGKAREYAASFQREQNVDEAYARAEKILSDLGPDKVKNLTNWASKYGYVTGTLTDDQKKFYDYLRSVAFISRNGLDVGSGAKGVTGTQLGSTVLGGANLGFELGQPLGGVKEAAEAIKANDLDSYDVAENIHKNRLLHAQEVVNNLAVASNDPTLPLDNRTLTEGRKWGNRLDGEVLEDGSKFSNIGDYNKAKTIWQIKADQDKAAGKTPQAAPADGTTPKDGAAPKEETAPSEQRIVPVNPNAKQLGEAFATDPGQAFQDVVQHPEQTWPEMRIFKKPLITQEALQKSPDLLKDWAVPASWIPQALGYGNESKPQSPAQTQTNQPSTTTDHLFPKPPKAPISANTPSQTTTSSQTTSPSKTTTQPSSDTGGDNTPAPAYWRDVPNLPPPVPHRVKPTAQAEPVQTNVEVGAPLGASDAPGVARLHHQEHVDALEPGTPFYWRDHADPYVRV